MPDGAELELYKRGRAVKRGTKRSNVIAMKPASLGLLLWAALLLATAMPVIASRHASAECQEGGAFIRNATISRENGLPKDAFLNHLIADLSVIRGLPEEMRWFAKDEADESLLVRHVERVYEYRMAPKDNEEAFLAECGRGIDQNQ